jgi:hypothetical protein
MIFRILNWFKRKENIKERKRAIVRLGHGLWPRPLHSQPSLGPNPRPTATGPSENKRKRKFALGTPNLFLKPFKPFNYFSVSGIFVSGTHYLFLIPPSTPSRSLVAKSEDGLPGGGGGDDETEAD